MRKGGGEIGNMIITYLGDLGVVGATVCIFVHHIYLLCYFGFGYLFSIVLVYYYLNFKIFLFI